jgi:hypothetical protein
MHLPRRWLHRELYEYLMVNLGPYLVPEPPVLVYQMGKVGSSSVRNALFRSPSKATRMVFMSHELLPIRKRDPGAIEMDEELRSAVLSEIADAKRLFAELPTRLRWHWLAREKLYTQRIHANFIAKGRPVNVITLVREPIAANISMFFQMFPQYVGVSQHESTHSVAQLARIFLERYVHSRPLTWFDAELEPTLGIDVFARGFPEERGYERYDGGTVRLLVLKSELDDAAKQSAIGDFLDLEGFEMLRSNVTARKQEADLYDRFKREARFDQAFLERMYGSKYARHFYSPRELERFRARWARPDDS